MMRLTFRWRMLLAAWVPVALVSVLLAAVFLNVRLGELRQIQQARWLAMTERLAGDSEGSLFAGDRAQMTVNLERFLIEPEVRWAELQDAQGRRLQGNGVMPSDVPGFLESRRLDTEEVKWMRVAVLSRPFTAQPSLQSYVIGQDGHDLGYVLVQFERLQLLRQEASLLWQCVAVALAGLLSGGLLAWWLSGKALVPMLRLTKMIERIGQGDFAAARLANDYDAGVDPLGSLQLVLEQAAQKLGASQGSLTEQVAQATAALQVKVQEAQQANLDKSRFLATASHDLRQPAHALGLLVGRLSHVQLDRSAQALVQQLEASVDALRALLDDLLDLSRLESGSLQVRSQAVALAPLFERLRQDLGEQARGQHLELRIRHSALWVQSDPVLLYQILLNLVSNALNYTPHGGVLLCARSTQKGEQVKLQIWDSGVGIDEQDQERIFQDFVRLERVTSSGAHGMGLGLAIVKRASTLLGHPIQLQSRLGVGSCFAVLMPSASAHALLVPPEPAPLDALDVLIGRCVLVIEDDVSVRQAMQILLTGWGMSVLVASSVQQALEILEQGVQPELLISDYNLGHGSNGLQAITEIRARCGPSLAVCLISGDPIASEAAKAVGVNLLSKPVRPARLRSLLSRLIQAT